MVLLRQLEPAAARTPQGFDGYVEPRRHLAMERALATARPAYTAALQLHGPRVGFPGGEAESANAFLIYYPAYGPVPAGSVHPGRQPEHRGFVSAGLRYGKLLRSLGSNSGDLRQALSVEDASGATLVYDSHPGEDRSANTPEQVTRFQVGGQTWRLHLATRPGFSSSDSSAYPRRVAAAGVAISMLLCALTCGLERAHGSRERFLSASLERTKARFQDLADAAPFGV